MKKEKILFSLSLGSFVLFLALKPKNADASTTEPTIDTGGASPTQAQINTKAFLKTIQYAEGTTRKSNPYSVTYAYKHTIKDFSDHPASTGEWTGEKLPDNYCRAVNLPTGCKSTAAGAYQIILPTWNDIKKRLSSLTFQAQDQDNAALFLIERRGALRDIEDGNFQSAIYKLNREWASLPGSPYGQPRRSMSELEKYYEKEGGVFIQA